MTNHEALRSIFQGVRADFSAPVRCGLAPHMNYRGDTPLPISSSCGLSSPAELPASSGLLRMPDHPEPMSAAAPDSWPKNRNRARYLSRQQQIREAVLLTLRESLPGSLEPVLPFSPQEWRELLHWLDISGLALYFIDRLTELKQCASLPSSVLNRLQQNLVDNASRTSGMVTESIAIQVAFQDAGISYAMLKGISLFPFSVRRPELRHQFDLDYLISEASIDSGRKILEDRGYRLHAISGRSWEFRRNETPHVSMEDMYKDLPGRTVELHVETNAAGAKSRLERSVSRHLYGCRMPALSPVDLFLSQGMHAFKDVCSAFARTAHLLEFYRHVIARRSDDAFWRELKVHAGADEKAKIGLGIVTYLISTVMGNFAPTEFSAWTVDVLPPKVRLWVDVYGRRAIFGEFPGTKLHLLLQKELEAGGLPATRSIRKSLLPTRLPPLLVRGSAGESWHTRFCRYRLQLRYIVSRLRYHVVEGIRYAWESYRWRRRTEQVTR